jgi:hypothetical protein
MTDTGRVRGVLRDGPMHGKVIWVDPGTDRITGAAPPEPPPPQPPRPPWWRFRARKRWPPLPPEPGPFRNLIYRYLATGDDGRRIYAWDEYAGRHPETEPLARDLYRYLVDHLYSKPPAERQRMHWVMDSEWWQECKKIGSEPLPPAGNGGHMTMLGLPVTVEEDGGIPHLTRGEF